MTKLINVSLFLALLLSSCSNEYVVYSNRFFSEKELRTLALDELPAPNTNGDTRLGIKSNQYTFFASIDSEDYFPYVNTVFSYLLTKTDITYVGYLVDAADLSSTVFVKHSDNIDDYQTTGDTFLFYYTKVEIGEETVKAYALTFGFSIEPMTNEDLFPQDFSYTLIFGVGMFRTISIMAV